MVRTSCAEIVCIIDRSGSMEAIRSDAIGGFNSFLEEQKKLPGDARLTLVLFNHEYGLIADGAPLSKIRPLSEETYVPAGTTALLDAVGRTLEAVRSRIDGMAAAARPDRVIVSILTDGFENASRDYTYERIGRTIAECRKKRGWEFVFLAANQDAFATGRSLSLPARDVVPFTATSEGIRTACDSIHAMVTESRTGRGRRGDAQH